MSKLSENISVNDEQDYITAFGINIAGELLRALSVPTPPGVWLAPLPKGITSLTPSAEG